MKHTCVAMYTREAIVIWVIPCSQALPDLVALTSFFAELGEVKIVFSGPVSLPRTGLGFNCKRLQKNWTAVSVHQRFESVTVPVHIF